MPSEPQLQAPSGRHFPGAPRDAPKDASRDTPTDAPTFALANGICAPRMDAVETANSGDAGTPDGDRVILCNG
ncbi:hypothetical protein [Pararhizobium sp. IMCC21322]|uniref:hypothetical protein n=1 Tax=Pararhizobium sp. IMCC21322 TaxID=3067903 RepID=UPI002740DAFC|nr:hypothetical protein [Pararhizobium sp. IMCC21322]